MCRLPRRPGTRQPRRRDHRGGCLQDELAECGCASGAGGDAHAADPLQEPGRVGRVPGPAAGEQPPCAGCCARGPGDQAQQHAGEGLRDRGRRVAEPDEDLALAVAGDVVGGEPDEAAGGLGVEQHQAGRDPVLQRRGLVGEDGPEQGDAAVLRHRRGPLRDGGGDRQPQHLTGGDRPEEEVAGGIAGVHRAGRVPGVQVGLGAAAEVASPAREPAEELAGGGELLACEPADGRGERLPPCPAPEPGELAPGPVLAQHPLVPVAGQGGELAVQPRLGVEQVNVARRERAAGHQQAPQVVDHPPVRQAVQRLVSKRDGAGRQRGQQPGNPRVPEPLQAALGMGRAEHGAGQRAHRRADLTGAVIEDGHQLLLQGAVLAEPPGQQQGLQPAAGAAEVAGDPGAVAAGGRAIAAPARQQPAGTAGGAASVAPGSLVMAGPADRAFPVRGQAPAGMPLTSRCTWDADSPIPRSASSGTSSDAVNMPREGTGSARLRCLCASAVTSVLPVGGLS
jgi:hypothetical protein